MGIGAGVALGLLWAPGKGARTRHALVEGAKQCVDDMVQGAHNLLETTTCAVEDGKDTLIRRKEGLKNAVEAGRRAYRQATT